MSPRNILVLIALLAVLAFFSIRECRKESHKSPIEPKDSSGSSSSEESQKPRVPSNSSKNTSAPSSRKQTNPSRKQTNPSRVTSPPRSSLQSQRLKLEPSARQTIPQKGAKTRTPTSLPRTRQAPKRTQAITKARERLYGLPIATILPFSFVCKSPSFYSSWEYAKQNSNIPEQQEILNRILKQDKSCLTLPSGARGKLDRKGNSFLGEKEGIICLKGNSPSTSYCSHPNNVVR